MGYSNAQPDWSNLQQYGVAPPQQMTMQDLSMYGQPAMGYQPEMPQLQPTNMQIQSAPGFNWSGAIGNFGTAAQGIGALASAYLGFQQMKAAKDGLNFQKEAFRTNLANQISSYNTSLEDRIRGRTSEHPGKAAEDQAYIDAHKLGG